MATDAALSGCTYLMKTSSAIHNAGETAQSQCIVYPQRGTLMLGVPWVHVQPHCRHRAADAGHPLHPLAGCMRLVGPHCIVCVPGVLELGNVAFSGATRPERGPRDT